MWSLDCDFFGVTNIILNAFSSIISLHSLIRKARSWVGVMATVKPGQTGHKFRYSTMKLLNNCNIASNGSLTLYALVPGHERHLSPR